MKQAIQDKYTPADGAIKVLTWIDRHDQYHRVALYDTGPKSPERYCVRVDGDRYHWFGNDYDEAVRIYEEATKKVPR